MPHSTEYLNKVTLLITQALEEYVLPVQEDSIRVRRKGAKAASLFKPVQQPTTSVIGPVLQGSMALLLHGVDFIANRLENPNDIDILISNPRAAMDAITQLNVKLQKEGSSIRIESPGGFHLVNELQIIDRTKQNEPLQVQLIDKEDFGLNKIKPVKVDGIPVIPVSEAIISLDYRIKMQGARPKDRFAYYTLIEKHGAELLLDPTISGKKSCTDFISNYLVKSPEERRELLLGRKERVNTPSMISNTGET